MIKSLDIEIFSHATEDEVLIKKAAEKIFDSKFDEKHLLGHFNNPIILFHSKLKKDKARKIMEKLRNNIVISDFGSHLDENKFFLRVSKSGILKGKFKMGGDVKLTCKIQIKKGESSIAFLKNFWKV